MNYEIDALHAEIERLTMEVGRWQRLANQGLQVERDLRTMITRMRAEIEELRAAHAEDQQRLFHYERMLADRGVLENED